MFIDFYERWDEDANWRYITDADWKAFVYWRWNWNLYTEAEEPISTPIPNVYLKAFGEIK